jgi:hypothetical protein
MRAELASLPSRGARWRFALGCVWVVATRLATDRVLTTGAGTGLAAVALWTAVVLATPPVPASAGGALVAIASGMAVSAYANTGPHGNPHRGLLAALCTGTVAALVQFGVVVLLASYGPANLIPDLAPAALTPADDFAQSRAELVDPYVAILFLGWLMTVALVIAAAFTRTAPTPPERESPPA